MCQCKTRIEWSMCAVTVGVCSIEQVFRLSFFSGLRISLISYDVTAIG